MIAVAIVGILAAISIPAYNDYVVRARVTDGLTYIGKSRADIVESWAGLGRLPATFEEIGWPAATGTANGGDTASFEDVFGIDHPIWRAVEWQPKVADAYVLVLRSKADPAWGGIDIGLHLQVKADGGAVRFRCTVNEKADRAKYVPASCRNGSVDDWNW